MDMTALNESIDISSRRDVVIVGAGIAGLVAAHFLQKRGFNILAIEKNSRVGGRTFTKQRYGISYAVGTQYLGEPQEALKTIYQDLSLSPLEYPTPFAGALSQGKLYLGEEGMLLRAVREAGLESIHRLVEIVNSVAEVYTDLPETHLISPLSELDQITAREWFATAGVGDALLQEINIEIRATFGFSLNEISALGFLSLGSFAMPVERSITPAEVQKLRPQVPFASGGTGWFGFPEGIIEIIRALATSIGSQLILGYETTRVERDGDGCLIHFCDRNGRNTVVRSKSVIMAVPAPVAYQIAESALDEERRNLLAPIEYSALAVVSLFSREPIFDRAFILNMPDGGRVVYLIDATWFQRGHGLVPPDSMRVVNALIVPVNGNDNRLRRETDTDLINVTLSEVEQAFPGAKNKIVDIEVTRHDPYMFNMPPGSHHRLFQLHALNQPPIVLAGDYLRGAHFQAAAETGRIAALKVEDALFARGI